MNVVGPGWRRNRDLTAGRGAQFRRINRRFDPKLLDGFHRDRHSSLAALRLINNAGRIHSIQSEVVLVHPASGKPNGSHIAPTAVDCAGRQRREAIPIPSIERKFRDLRPTFRLRFRRRAFWSFLRTVALMPLIRRVIAPSKTSTAAIATPPAGKFARAENDEIWPERETP